VPNDARIDAMESHKKETRQYLTPEEAAEMLGVHVQTMPAYVRGGRVPAFRLAGERPIRLRRAHPFTEIAEGDRNDTGDGVR
jgi:excisionase family DNA binding protein